jgi:hypothetical protein
VFLSLPSGGVFSTASLTSGNPSDIVLIPGTGFAYLRENTRLLPLDYINNVQLPSIELGNANGAVVDWVLEGNLLVTLLSGIAPTPFGGTTAPAAVHAADVTIHAAALPAPVPLPTFGGTLLRAGPGSAGPALFALLSSTGLIVELSPGTLAPVGTVTVPVNTSHLELSAGRMDWLIMQSGRNPTPFSPGVPGMLLRMDPATQAVSALSATPAERQQHLLPVASDSLRKAHIVSGTGDLFALSTDPAGLPGPAIPLPVSSQALSVTGNR